MVRAYRDIESVKTTLRGVRHRVGDFHAQVYKQILLLSRNVDVQESTPRQASRQQHRQNIPSDNITDYYKHNLTISILDHLINELDVCFSSTSQKLVEFMQLLPSQVVKTTTPLQLEDFTDLLQLYEDDLPSVKLFDVELDLAE